VAIFKQLAKSADVIVENYRPDVKRRLGIDYEQIREINPRLVYGSISGFGQTTSTSLPPATTSTSACTAPSSAATC
jgi:crotonobetainyl-CoA:carnitine CoA-transferase CaiB-like acyl-CoA transferase